MARRRRSDNDFAPGPAASLGAGPIGGPGFPPNLAALRTITFHLGVKGYAVDDVDLFLAHAAAEAEAVAAMWREAEGRAVLAEAARSTLEAAVARAEAARAEVEVALQRATERVLWLESQARAQGPAAGG